MTGNSSFPARRADDGRTVVHLRPDAPGTYVLTLDAPDGTHRQRVRAYPDERQSVELRVPAADPGGRRRRGPRLGDVAPQRPPARARPSRARRRRWIYEVQIPPGRHGFSFVANDDPGNEHRDEVTVPGPGRPRVSMSATVVEGGGGEGTPTPHPSGSLPTPRRRPTSTARAMPGDAPASPRRRRLPRRRSRCGPRDSRADRVAGGGRHTHDPACGAFRRPLWWDPGPRSPERRPVRRAETIRIERDEEGPWAPARAAP